MLKYFFNEFDTYDMLLCFNIFKTCKNRQYSIHLNKIESIIGRIKLDVIDKNKIGPLFA